MSKYRSWEQEGVTITLSEALPLKAIAEMILRLSIVWWGLGLSIVGSGPGMRGGTVPLN